MQDLINKVKAYNELQEETIQFIDKLANHVMDINEVAYEDLIELKDMIYSDEILLQDAIKKATSIFDSIVK